MDEDKSSPADDNNEPVGTSEASTDVQETTEQQTDNQEAEQEGQDNGQESTEEGGDNQATDEKPTRKERRKARYVERLSRQLEEARGNNVEQNLNNRPNYKPIEYGEQEYQIDDLNRDRSQYGQEQYQQGINQAQQIAQTTVWRDQVERDNDYVDRKYPILDEGSDEFDPDIANYLNNLYLQTTGFDGKTVKNPVRYRDFVRANMEVAERLSTTRNAETAQNLAKQSGRASVKAGSANRRSGRDWSEPGAIAALSSDEYDKFKPEIEAWMSSNIKSIR